MQKYIIIFLFIFLTTNLYAAPFKKENSNTKLIPATGINKELEMKEAQWLHTVKGLYKDYYTDISTNKIIGTKWAGIEVFVPLKSSAVSDVFFINNKGEQAMRRLLKKFCSNFNLINYMVIDQFSVQVHFVGGKQVIVAEGNLNCIR